MIIILFIVFFVVGIKSFKQGNCTQRNGSGQRIWFCCDNHELIRGTCVECLHGFEAIDGSSCKPCENGRYGRKCGYHCRCLHNQRCDHKTGCIQGSSNISTEPVSSPSTVSTIIAAFTSESVWFTTEIQTENGVEDDNIHSTIYTSSSFEKKETTTSMSTKKGLLEREIVIYSLSAAVLVLFILLCTACQQRYQKVYGNLKKYQTSKRRRRNIQENPLPEIPLEDIEGVYDVIDELNMINDFENVMDSNFSSESETNGGYVQPDNNGYLTPYQPVDEDSNTSNINDIKSVSLQTPNANGDAISDHVSITSSSGVHGRKCSNINTNRPLDHPVDTQDYISTHSSDLETISRESGYLNPYQPMIPATDLHEYKYVIGFSDGSGSSLSETSTKEIGAYISNPYQDLTSEIDTHDYI